MCSDCVSCAGEPGWLLVDHDNWKAHRNELNYCKSCGCWSYCSNCAPYYELKIVQYGRGSDAPVPHHNERVVKAMITWCGA
jgi:hypothetical protein